MIALPLYFFWGAFDKNNISLQRPITHGTGPQVPIKIGAHVMCFWRFSSFMSS